MPSFFPIRGLANSGVIADVPSYDLPLSAFTSATNVVFRDGAAKRRPGYQSATFNTGTDLPDEDPSWFQTWETGGSVYVAFFCEDSVYVWDGSTLTEATTPTLTNSNLWTSDLYGEYAIATNQLSAPIYNSAANGSTWATLPGWTDIANGAPGGQCKAIRGHKGLLMAVGLPNTPYTVYWSDLGELGAIPDNWATADPSSFAGFVDLDSADGDVVDCRQLGDVMVVYCRFAAYAFTFTGNIRSPFTVRRLFNWGLVSQECVQSYGSYHFCVGDRAIYIHDGSTVNRIGSNRVEAEFFNEKAGAREYFRVSKYPDQHEIMIYAPKPASVAPRRNIAAVICRDRFSLELGHGHVLV